MHMPLVLTNRRRRGGSASAPAFSPSSLYSSGSQGIWLDPSDLSTMFSDRAGTTPVTTPGTVVGLRLDKSKGLVVSSTDTLNGKGDFSDPAYWSDASAVSTITGGQLVFSGASTTGGKFSPDSPATLAIGSYYEISFDVVSISQGGIKVWAGTSQPSYTATTSGRHTYRSLCTGDVRARVYNNGTATTAVVDNVTFKLISGNHATAPTDAARPTYGVEPKGGRRNLLLATDTLATQSLTVTAVAHTLAFTGTGTVTLSGASTAGPLVGTGAGDRVTLTFTPTAASLTLTVSGSVTLGQLELGSSATAYQKVVTAYDVTESGVATTHYVQYDGSDDSMSTSAIDFTATDKMSVFAGVRKLSDAAISAIIGLSGTPTASAGTFELLSPTTNGGTNYRMWSGGTSYAGASAAGYGAPISNVVTGLGDISGDRATLRINGAQVAQDTADQGTGNYGNYPLFIGRRNNATLPFNGRDYGIVIVGKAASAGEITDTETWLAAKTSEVDVAKSISPNIYTRSGDTILDRANSIIERRTV